MRKGQRKCNMQQYKITQGFPFPLGATKTQNGWNFSIFSEKAPTLVIKDQSQKLKEISFDPQKHHIGNIWHIGITSEENTIHYLYKVEYNNAPIYILDPYAKLIQTGNTFGHNHWHDQKTPPFAVATVTEDFDWENDAPPLIPKENLIIYEMHVRGYTQDPSSKVTKPGTFLGLIEKIPHLLELGINAVELLPIFEFDENEYKKIYPKTKEQLYNYWGYSPLSFFSPMQRYTTQDDPLNGAKEFKEMVKALHKAGIEVILDVVYNHTGEGGKDAKPWSWKGFSEKTYYLESPTGEYLNYSGCGNTLNCNTPITQELIIDSLRHWIYEYHIDGFRFDLASILTREQDGKPSETAALIESISEDPVIKTRKLIAEPWDAEGLYQVGSFFRFSKSNTYQWQEWNDTYRDTVRNFIKGTDGFAGKFATKLCGSEDLFGNGGSPLTSINFITSHDGFTLKDLVSYNKKHNMSNGEHNRDGMNNNYSWNCGHEGDTTDERIIKLRNKQMKNYLLALFCSQGIPMLLMGDEFGHTRDGNNNTWCHDNDLNWFCWEELSKHNEIYCFCKNLVQFRKDHPVLRRNSFLDPRDVFWHGKEPFTPDWSEHSRFVAFTLKDNLQGNDLYIAFNSHFKPVSVTLPSLAHEKSWHLVVDTNADATCDFTTEHKAKNVGAPRITMGEYSSIILRAS